jgi:hypothetical protein
MRIRGTCLAENLISMSPRCPIHLGRAAGPLSCALVALLAIAPPATADPEDDEHAAVVRPRPPSPEPTPTPLPPPAHEPTATDVMDAPLPGEESGRTDPIDGDDSASREIARGFLFFPRLALNVALAPVRGGLWVYERYRLDDLYRRIFFNDAMTIGLYPTIVIDSSLGVFAGARFEHRDLLGAREKLLLQAAIGNRYRQIYSVGLRSGDRLGKRVRVELDAAYERRPHDAFWGIGNGDEMTAPGAPLDPLVGEAAVQSHYRQDRARVLMVGDVRVWRGLHLRAAGALSDVEFGRGDRGAPIDQLYMQDRLIGWDGARYAYSELGLRWDGRRSASDLEPLAVYSAGTLLDLYSGRTHRLDDGPDFWRYGLDLQHFLRFADGPRVIIARLHGEAVSGGRDEVPFSELPMLGGPTHLRGYDLDRFRDRVAAVGSLAYQWDLSQRFSANVFVDAGRVYPSLAELSLEELRMGYGLGVELHSGNSFLVEGSVASSIDGGLHVNLSFNRVLDLEERVRRK